MSSPVEQALVRLVAAGTLTPEQSEAVMREVMAAAPAVGAGDGTAGRPAWSSVVGEVGGYIGGAFVLAAAVVLTGPRWHGFGTAERVAVLGVPAAVLLAAAVAVLALTPGGWPVHHRPDAGPRRRLAAALLLVVAALVAGIAGVLRGDTSSWQEVAFTATGTAALAAGYLAVRTPLLHVATAVAAGALAPMLSTHAVHDWRNEGLWAGLAIIVVALVWLALSGVRAFDEPALGATVAALLAFAGAEAVATGETWNDLGYPVLAVVAAGGLIGYVRTRHVGILAVGVVALATVVPQAVLDWTDGAFGAAGALLVTGLSILGASVVGLRLRGTTRGPTT